MSTYLVQRKASTYSNRYGTVVYLPSHVAHLNLKDNRSVKRQCSGPCQRILKFSANPEPSLSFRCAICQSETHWKLL